MDTFHRGQTLMVNQSWYFFSEIMPEWENISTIDCYSIEAATIVNLP